MFCQSDRPSIRLGLCDTELTVQVPLEHSTEANGSSGTNWLHLSFSKNLFYISADTPVHFRDSLLGQVCSLGFLSLVYNPSDTPSIMSDPSVNYRVLYLSADRQTLLGSMPS